MQILNTAQANLTNYFTEVGLPEQLLPTAESIG